MARKTVARKRAPINKTDRIFYVYALYREDGRPFYIGKGVRDRWLHHEKQAQRGRSYKDNLIASMQEKGITIFRKKLATDLTHRQACKIEISLIKKFGRHPHGPLTNVTGGGEGTTPGEPRPDLSIALRKREFTWRDKLLAAAQRPEVRQKHSLRTTGTLWFNDGTDSYRVKPGGQIELGWRPGRIMVTKSTKGRILITDGTKNTSIRPEDSIPEGWRRGATQKHNVHKRSYKHPHVGKLRINDGNINAFINPGDPIPEGWKRGHLQPNNRTRGGRRITNGSANRLLLEGEDMPDGWRYGATQNHGPRQQ